MPFVFRTDPEYNDRIGRDKSRGYLGLWGDLITDSDWQRASSRAPLDFRGGVLADSRCQRASSSPPLAFARQQWIRHMTPTTLNHEL
jgi:hypothetical protein